MASHDQSGAALVRQAVRARLERWRGRGIVVAVSGGGDSVGLLRALHEFGPEGNVTLSVAHLNHGVRGAEAEADARFVADLAEALGLDCESGHWAPERPGHFEADARRARYRWLAEVARKRGASAVAVGHNRDDQAETILHRIVRGTGLRGLAGMPASRPLADGVMLIRPLLRISRTQIRDYLGTLGQVCRDDATNADLSRTRARIRHDLLPKLKTEYNPKVAEALDRLGRLAAAGNRAWRPWIDRLTDRAIVSIGDLAVILLVVELRRLPPILGAEVIRRAWRRAAWPEGRMSAALWARLAALARLGGGRATVAGGIDAWVSNGILRLSPASSIERAARFAPVRLPLPGSVAWDGNRITATFDEGAVADEWIDFDRLDPWRNSRGESSVLVRDPRDGDRFEPLGMGGRSLALNDFFRGRHVAKDDRARVPIVADRAGIIWVVGHRIGNRARTTATTRRRLGLSWEAGENPLESSALE
jgi:tRNA(Ile)-lysidine synthase